MAAAVEGDDGGIFRQPLRHRLPELRGPWRPNAPARRGAATPASPCKRVGNADAVAGAGTAVGTGGAAKIGVQRKPLWNAADSRPSGMGRQKIWAVIECVDTRERARQERAALSSSMAATRSPNALVPSGPPRSRVRVCGSAMRAVERALDRPRPPRAAGCPCGGRRARRAASPPSRSARSDWRGPARRCRAPSRAAPAPRRARSP